MATPTGLESLSPAYRAQYEAALPGIKRSARSASQARGMFYSGDAIDSETRAEEDLLAKLSAESAGATQQSSEAALNRKQEQDRIDREAAATKRGQTLGIIGTGFGALGTGAGLMALHPNGGNNTVTIGNRLLEKGPNGWTDVTPPASVGGTQLNGQMSSVPSNAGVGGLEGLNPPGPTAMSVEPGGPGISSPWHTAAGVGGTGAAGVAGADSPGLFSTMWSRAGEHPVLGLAAGAGGGLAGNALAAKIGGGHSLGGDIGSGLGGLAGAGLGAYAGGGGYGSLLGLGLGALGGSLGGGLIGNLFK